MSLSKADPAFIDGVLADGAARTGDGHEKHGGGKEILGFVQ